MNVQFRPLGDCAVFVYFGHTISEEVHLSIKQFLFILEENPFEGLIEIVPSYTNVCIYYDVAVVAKWKPKELSPYEKVIQVLQTLLQKEVKIKAQTARLIEIPVCYGGIFGPDLTEIAAYHRLSEQQIIHLHTKNDYLVYMLGFAPGFPYLGGMDERIATPRKETPRLKIPAGSVGIAGSQTGIYPLETPGGWQIIGRTPKKLFFPNQDPPSLIQAGDKIRFVPITEKEFFEMGGEIE